ncbi:MAG: His/Gly/Thr/Pro-type tRNA ligase C-terminal domain-containing protein, partial [Candidatus Bathyarchaeia archaeon]
NLGRIIGLARVGGVGTPFLVDLGFARGLEYYTGMIFEVFVPALGIALIGGGRYDRLVELFGGEPTPAVGCAPGIDRIVLAMEKLGLFPSASAVEDKVLVVPVDESLSPKAFELAAELRRSGIAAHGEVVLRGVGRALSYADRRRCMFTVIVGARELDTGCVTLRDMRRKEQREVPIGELADTIKSSM